MPLSTSVNRSRISGVGAAQGHGAGDVGGGVEILAAAVDQVERAAGQRPVALRRGAVVRQGGVGAVGRDRIEAGAAKQRVLGALRLQPRGRTLLVEAAVERLGCRARPESAPRPHRRGAARRRRRRARPGSSAPWPARRGRRPRPAWRPPRPAGRESRHAPSPGRPAPDCRHARVRSSALVELFDRLDRDRIGQVQAARAACAGRRTSGRCRPGSAGEAQHQRIVGDVAAAQVEQPGDRVGRGQQRARRHPSWRPRPRSARAWRHRPRRHRRSSWRRTGAIGGGGRSGQIAIDRIRVERDQRAARLALTTASPAARAPPGCASQGS